MVDAEVGIIIQRKLELVLELILTMCDDEKELFSVMRSELEQVLYIIKKLKGKSTW